MRRSWEASWTARPPRRTVRKPSPTSGGSLERLARVFLRMRLPSRRASRSRMAGLLAQLGMISTWKDTGEYYGNITGNVSDREINCNKNFRKCLGGLCYGNIMPVTEASGREEAL